tara:strand:+ start:268 stop:720 length:453 start_codon:yes stop_codon:yes gene_type:complete
MELATAFKVASTVATVASAAGQVKSGMAQREGYNLQAQQAELRGRSEAIAYKQKGVDALRNLNETLASIVARAGAGGVDPTSGSAATLQGYAMGEGVREFNIAADNAAMAIGQASMQANIYRQAGKSAQFSSNISAVGTLGQGAYQYGQV